MLNKIVITAAAAAIAVSALSAPASAGGRYSVPTIWVIIDAYPDEGLWEACRRVFKRDVYHVRGGPDIGLVRCNVHHSRKNG